MGFLHFSDKPQQLDDGLVKVRFLINHLNNAMPKIYASNKELSLDESMMLWRVLINVLAIHLKQNA